MTYREKLELYSQGKLDEQQKIEIERDLEKQEALADFLFEHQAPPGMDDLFDGTSPFGAEEDRESPADSIAAGNTDEVTKQINRSIRKAFVKTGVIAAIAAIVLTLFVVFAMPHIVSAFYYDPGKSIGVDENGTEIEQFERDMSVYGEMFMPELGPSISVGTDSYGYGNYSYYIDARYNVGARGDENVTNVYTGNMKRNSVTCYNYAEIEEFNKKEDYFSEDPETAAKALARMNDENLYCAYVTFDKELPYEQFYADYVDHDEYGTNSSWVWCGVRVSEEEKSDSCDGYYNEGFFATVYMNETRYGYDEDRYPGLAWEDGVEPLDNEKKAAAHFKSMINYLADSGKFTALSNHMDMEDLYSISEAENYVSKNGLKVYGFVYVGDKEHVNNVAKAKDVQQITVKSVD